MQIGNSVWGLGRIAKPQLRFSVQPCVFFASTTADGKKIMAPARH